MKSKWFIPGGWVTIVELCSSRDLNLWSSPFLQQCECPSNHLRVRRICVQKKQDSQTGEDAEKRGARTRGESSLVQPWLFGQSLTELSGDFLDVYTGEADESFRSSPGLGILNKPRPGQNTHSRKTWLTRRLCILLCFSHKECQLFYMTSFFHETKCPWNPEARPYHNLGPWDKIFADFQNSYVHLFILNVDTLIPSYIKFS